MRTALVTGSSGFIGRHMVRALVDHGWDVRGIDLLPAPVSRASSPGAVAIDGGRYAHAVGDLREALSLPSTMRFDLVVHCAYRVGGRAAIDGEPLNLAYNLELDAGLFRWAVATGQRAVLYYSSSAAYPVRLQHGDLPSFDPRAPGAYRLREVDIDLDRADEPDARYGWAKLTGERLARAASEAGLRVHVLRPFSGYGGDQDGCYPFPAIVRRVAQDGDLTVWGPRGQVRDWVHVDDVIGASLAVYEADERRPVNICSGEATEFGALAYEVAYASGRSRPDGPQPDVTYREDRPTGVLHRVGSPDRMHEHYRPRVTLDEGIARAIAELK